VGNQDAISLLGILSSGWLSILIASLFPSPYLWKFTLASVMEEINRWWQAGHSCFTKLLKTMKLRPCAESVLDNLMPVPDG